MRPSSAELGVMSWGCIIRALLLLIALLPPLACASEQCAGVLHPYGDRYGHLSCEEKVIVAEWIEMAMSTPAEKAVHLDRWKEVLASHPDLTTDIIEDFVNSTDYDGAGNYEKWGILRDLPPVVKANVIRKSFDGFVSGDGRLFNSFIYCWGPLLLETRGFDNVVSRLDSFDFFDKYNSELLKVAIRHNYSTHQDVGGFVERLMEVYREEYSDMPEWYEPDYILKGLGEFAGRLNEARPLTISNVPLVVLP